MTRPTADLPPARPAEADYKVYIEGTKAMYDGLMYDPLNAEFYSGSDFSNFGYWDSTTGSQKQACELLMEKLLAFIPEKKGTVLDVACGKGATSAYLGRSFRPEDVTGINISEKQLETCRANAPGSRFLLMDATSLQFDDRSFDDVVCVEAAFHFRPRTKFLEEAHRVLKPGGHLVLCDLLEGTDPIQDAPAYAEALRTAGFQDVRSVDATEECWFGFCRHFVSYAFDLFFKRRIDEATLKQYLQSWIYETVPKARAYVLVAGRKA